MCLTGMMGAFFHLTSMVTENLTLVATDNLTVLVTSILPAMVSWQPKPTALSIQHREIVECSSDGGVILAERLLADRERIVQQVGRLLVFVLIPGKDGTKCSIQRAFGFLR